MCASALVGSHSHEIAVGSIALIIAILLISIALTKALHQHIEVPEKVLNSLVDVAE